MSVVTPRRPERTPDELALIAAADASRARTRRRQRIGWIVGIGTLGVVIIAFVIGAIGFQQSWWLHPSRPASNDQVTSAGDTRFTDAGRDYAGRRHLVRIDLRDDTRASALGLPADGTTTATFAIPLTIRMTAGGTPFEYPATYAIRLSTRSGRLVAVHIPSGPDRIQPLLAEVGTIAGADGWSAQAARFSTTALTQWDTDRTADATFGPVKRGGLVVSARLRNGSQGLALDWVIAPTG